MTYSVKCPRCYGEGCVQLSESLREVLDILLNHNGDEMLTTIEVYAELLKAGKIDTTYKVTAINNRLAALLELDLVKRFGQGTTGRPYQWDANRV